MYNPVGRAQIGISSKTVEGMITYQSSVMQIYALSHENI